MATSIKVGGLGLPKAWTALIFLAQICIFYNVAILTIGSATAAPGGGSGPECLITTVMEPAVEAMWEAAHKKCNEPKFDYPDIKSSLDTFDVDDKCYNQCLYKELGVVSDDGKIKKAVTDAIFKGNMTAEIASKNAKIWDSCVDDCEKVMTKKADKPCMVFPMHMFCFQKKIVEEKVYNKC